MQILIVGDFSDDSIERIKNDFPNNWHINICKPDEVYKYIESCDVLLPEHIKVDKDLLDNSKKLKFIQTGAGYDNIDIKECSKRGIKVANAAGVNCIAVAEHTVALILAYYKNISKLDSFMKGNKNEFSFEYKGSEVFDKTIGIIGLGDIGKRLAKYCHAFGMNILAYDIKNNIEHESYIKMVKLEKLLSESDIISIHIFLNDETNGFIDLDLIEKLKKDVLIVNTSRGKIINEKDLIFALEKNMIGGACLDVFEEEPLPKDSKLRGFENIILTPHTAGMPDGLKYHKRRYKFFVENIKRYYGNKDIESALN